METIKFFCEIRFDPEIVDREYLEQLIYSYLNETCGNAEADIEIEKKE